MPSLGSLWQIQFLGNDLRAWTLAAVTFLFTFTVLPLLKRYFSARRRRSLEKGQQVHTAIDVAGLMVERTSRVFLWSVAFYLASRDLTFPPRIEGSMALVIVVLFWMQVGLWAMAAVRYAIDQRRRRSAGLDALLSSSMDVILFVAGLLIWGMVLLLALDNLGVEIKPLLAGLGIGGIAVALAVQTVLSDVLASVSIALDKPFSIGDSLKVDDFQGTVEHIGVKSTRLRSLSGEQIIMGNTDILKSRVRNFGRMRERRAVFQLTVAYDTGAAALEAIPGAIRELIGAIPATRFERCHFLAYTDSGLQFETVYFVTNSDFNAYADIQQRLNLEILERFRAMNVRFATSARVVYVENQSSTQRS